jgi:hypothetical protein
MANATVTRGRSTRLRIDAETWGIGTMGYAFERKGSEIGIGDNVQGTNVQYVSNVGWQLVSYQDSQTLRYESTLADSAFQKPGVNAAGSSKLTAFKTSRQFTDYPPASGAYGGSYPATAAEMLQLRYTSSDTSPDSISADQTAWPSPDTAGDAVPMDRLLVSNGVHEPDEALKLEYECPYVGAASTVISIQFSGPAGEYADGKEGRGEYALKVDAFSRCKLYELVYDDYTDSTGTWRKVFEYAAPNVTTPVRVGVLTIISDCKLLVGGFRGRTLSFYHTDLTYDGNTLVDSWIAASVRVVQARTKTPTATYTVPATKDQKPTTLSQIRIDARRDIRLRFGCSTHVYPSTGSLTDEIVRLPFIPSSTTTVQVEWFGSFPVGTDIVAKLFDADTGLEITGGATTTIPFLMKIKTFPLSPTVRNIYVRYDFSTSDSTKTPTLFMGRLITNPVATKVARTPVTTTKIQRVSLNGATDSPQVENGSIVVNDPLGGISDPIDIRSGMPIILDTSYDPADATKKSILFRGYVKGSPARQIGAKRTRTGGTSTRYADDRWKAWTLVLASEAHRLDRYFTSQAYNYAVDPNALDANGAPQPWKVTDAIISLLKDAGYPEEMLDIPDSALRFFAVPGQDLYIEYRTPILAICERWARDYLGGYLVFDANACADPIGDPTDEDGMWRLVYYPRPQADGFYYHLAHFLLDIPSGATTPVVVSDERAYPATTGDSGQTLKRTFVQHGTLLEDRVEPEANHIEVFGVDPASTNLANFKAAAGLVQSAYNFDSALFFDTQPTTPDTSSVDYLGYERTYSLFDVGLTTQSAVDFACRRLYDVLCHGRYTKKFKAPLILVTDATDEYQLRPRPLRFGDPVKFGSESQTYIVRSVNIDYTHDSIQWAWYELETPIPLISEYAS